VKLLPAALRSRLCQMSDAVRQRRYRVIGAVLLLAGTRFVLAQPVPLPPGTSSPDQQTEEPSSPLADVESAIEARNYLLATARVDVYLSTHPTDARALFDRGYVLDAQGHPDAAESWYRKAIAADPKQFEAHLALGLILAAKNTPTATAAAREQLEAATQLEPNPPNPAAKAQADPLVNALKLTPETPDDTLLAAEIAEAAGNGAIAEQEYRRALAADPNLSDAAAGLVHLLLDQKRYADAQPLVEAALRRDPDDPTLNAQLAAILNAQGNPAGALAVLEKLHAHDPGSRSIATMLADTCLQTGKLDEADALYQQLLSQTPSDPDLLDAHAQVLIRQQHYAEAVAAFRRATAARSDDVDAWSGIAFADSELHQYQDELAALSMRSKFAPETPASLFLWATAYDNLHQIRQAADYYHRFLAAAQGKFPDQEWQARHRLVALGSK